jgi:predicted esterase
VDAIENHTATVIWLHSFGDTGGYFASKNLDLPGTLAMPWIRYIFPTACEINTTINGGILQPAWFDVTRTDERSVWQDSHGLDVAASCIAELVSSEIALGIAPHRVILAGFGQVSFLTSTSSSIHHS